MKTVPTTTQFIKNKQKSHREEKSVSNCISFSIQSKQMARVTWESNKVHTILHTVEQKAWRRRPLVPLFPSRH